MKKLNFALDIIVTVLLVGSLFIDRNGLVLVGALGWVNLTLASYEKYRNSKYRMAPPECAFPIYLEDKLKDAKDFALGLYAINDGKDFALRRYEEGNWSWINANTENVISDEEVKNYKLINHAKPKGN